MKFAYDPIVPDKENLNVDDAVAVKDKSGKYFLSSISKVKMLPVGRKILYTVDGKEYSIIELRKCYPAI